MSSPRLNILYIICHDLGRHLGCYGVPVRTPNLDGFAAQSACFTQAFCNSPACSPSRGCAMTGQYAHTNGLMGLVNLGWSLPEGAKTVVDYLNEAGYETAHFGVQHERFRAAANRYQIEGNAYSEQDWVEREEEWAERAIDRAVAFLEQRRRGERPFYLNVGTLEVHASRWEGCLPAGSAQNRATIYGVDPPEQVYLPPGTPDTPQLRSVFGRFQRAIQFLDGQVQRLFEALERLDYADNTLVVFTTDHGIANMRSKKWIYDRGTEIALMMRLPGVIHAGRVEDLIANMDMAPTLLQVAGVPIPAGMQGRSFWPRLTGKPYQPHEAIFIERNWHNDYDPMRAVRTPRLHYIRNFGVDVKQAWQPGHSFQMNETYQRSFYELWPEPNLPRPAEELYDVVNDPEEWVNLAGRADYADLQRDLAAQLDEWMRSTQDPLLRGDIPNKLHGWTLT